MTTKIKHTLIIVGMALILAVVLAANILCGIFNEMITVFLSGYGVNTANLDYEQGDAVCQDIAAEGLVLLKNTPNGLPMKNVTKVNVFGWGSTDGGFIVSGAGSGSSDDRGSGEGKVTLLSAFEREGIEYNTALTKVYTDFAKNRDNGDYWNAAYPFFNLIEPAASALTDTIMNQAVEYSDTAIVVISRLGGEGQDLPREQRKLKLPTDTTRTYLQLSTEEEGMLAKVKAAGFARTIILLNTCNTMELGFVEDESISAVLSISCPGQSGSISVVKALKGEINPSGKTVDAYAYDLTTAATYANAPDCRNVNSKFGGVHSYTNGGYYIDYAESIYVGYKWYETADAMGYWDDAGGYNSVVQYPFGYGLSYTNFEWKVQSVSPASGSTVTPDTTVEITVSVTNKGDVAGKDVVEVYFNPPYTDGIEKASKNLCAFAKTELLDPAGGSKDSQLLTLKFKVSEMKSYDYTDANDNGIQSYELEKGTYTVTVQTDSHNVSTAANSTLTYKVARDYDLSKDEVTNEKIENRFTGETADDGVSIDGTNSNANIVYLSRANFKETFPAITTERRAKTSNITALGDNWKNTAKDTNDMPLQGVKGDLRLVIDDEENPGTKKLNMELVNTLGADYDDIGWDLLLDQITVSELVTLVQGGGYRTAKIDSIGKPEVLDLDGPSGLNDTNMTAESKANWTSFPVETMIASAWSDRLAYVYGLAVGKEANETGVGGWYAPGANIHRSPFSGRNFEYYSEDPFLSGIMASSTVRGATNNGLYCYVKHFAVNDQENNRAGLYTWLTEQALREVYLRPFEMCVKLGNANAIMSAFNRIGATWVGGSYSLLTTILRDEWGFRGTVVTDYSNGGSYMNVDQGIRAGNDIWLNGSRANSLPGGGYNDKTSATAVSCARDAAKNVIYTYLNTRYLQSNYKPSDDELMFKTELTSSAAAKAAAYWIIGVVAFDVVVVAGLGVWIYFIFIRPKRKEKAQNKTA